MITGLKLLSLACKCVCYRTEHKAKREPMELSFEGFEM